MSDPVLPVSRDTQTILDALRHIVQALRRSSAGFERAANLTAAQAFILKTLQAHPWSSVNELSGYVHASQSTVSETVARLVNRGLVMRRQALADRRRVELCLSETGAGAIAEGVPMPQDALVNAIAAMPEAKRIALADGLTALVTDARLGDVAPPLFFEESVDAS